jgi:hypothetical protein
MEQMVQESVSQMIKTASGRSMKKKNNHFSQTNFSKQGNN